MALVCVAGVVAGCGGGGEQGASTFDRRLTAREVRVTLDGYAGPQSVGVVMAERLGYFAEVGIRPVIAAPAEPRRPIYYVGGGTDDFGLTQQPQAVLAQEEGVPVVAVGGLVTEPTAALIWLPGSGIGDLADLEGKTIAVPGVPFQEAILLQALGAAGLKPDEVRIEAVGYELVPALLSGRADAIFAGWNVEGIELESRGLDPVVTRVEALGVPAYEDLVVIAGKDLVAEDPDLVRNFMSAVIRGTEAAVADPQAAAVAISGSTAGRTAGGQVTEAQVEATLPLLSESAAMDPDRAEALVDWMRRQGLIEKPIPTPAFQTDEFLPDP